MIALTGTTGGLGSQVLKHLLPLVPASQLILSLYNPSLSNTAHFPAGVTVRRGDFSDPVSLDAAFAGAERLLIVSYPSIKHEVPMRYHANAIDTAKRAGVKHIYYTSLSLADGSVSEVMQAHLHTEKYLKESGVTYTIIREGIYSESYPFYLGFFDKSKTDVYVPGDGRIAWVSREDLGEGTARIIAGGGFENQTVLLTGPASNNLTLHQLSTSISRILARPLALHIVPGRRVRRAKQILKPGRPAQLGRPPAPVGKDVRRDGPWRGGAGRPAAGGVAWAAAAEYGGIFGEDASRHRSFTMEEAMAVDLTVDNGPSFAEHLGTQKLQKFNATRPAVSLPPEVLASVFTYMLSASPPFRIGSKIEIGWIRVTHVCRRWREVATSTAILWTEIEDLGPHWTRIFMERARNASLRLDRYRATSESSPPVEDIASRLFQIHTLHIIGLHRVLCPLVDRLHYPAPRLESLDVDIRNNGDYQVSTIHGPLLNGGGGPLRHLRFSDLFFQWSTFAFSNLVSLSLVYRHPEHYRNGEEKLLPSIPSMIDIIRGITRLEKLHLLHAVYAPDDEELRHFLRPLSLPHLEQLSIMDHKGACASLLRNLDITPEACIAVNCSDSTSPAWETDGDIDALLNMLAKYSAAAAIHLGEFSYLSCQLNPIHGGGFEIFMRNCDGFYESFTLTLPDDRGGNWLPRLKAVLSRLPNDHVEIVEVRNEIKMTEDEWTECFVMAGLRWTKVASVLVEMDRECAFILALLDLDAEAIPALRMLIVDAEPLGLALEMLDEVASCVISARERGVPLECIALCMAPESEGVEQWKNALAAIVPEFQYSPKSRLGQGLNGPPGFSLVETESDSDEEEDMETSCLDFPGAGVSFPDGLNGLD
ncbi:hypothetical protein EVG20_g4096 [Dentipellis fragilis]|uniref:F-box domain-containing protein n=1 Tax=Dentipellis fragilis TaxID=205917 RepID=A0A4Y9YZ18_9AGAM|nr:hypothetical protein EVG20_g4096 [Dentipellis fragilis]